MVSALHDSRDVVPAQHGALRGQEEDHRGRGYCHGHLHREEDGAIEFWRLKDHLRNDFVHSQYWSDDMWKSKMAGGRGRYRLGHGPVSSALKAKRRLNVQSGLGKDQKGAMRGSP